MPEPTVFPINLFPSSLLILLISKSCPATIHLLPFSASVSELHYQLQVTAVRVRHSSYHRQGGLFPRQVSSIQFHSYKLTHSKDGTRASLLSTTRYLSSSLQIPVPGRGQRVLQRLSRYHIRARFPLSKYYSLPRSSG